MRTIHHDEREDVIEGLMARIRQELAEVTSRPIGEVSLPRIVSFERGPDGEMISHVLMELPVHHITLTMHVP